MTIFSGILFLHVVSVLGIVAALSLEALVLYHLRRGTDAREARVSIDLAPGLPVIFAASALMAVLTGAYLTVHVEAWPQAWLRISLVALVLLAPFGAVSARKMRAIRSMSGPERVSGAELVRRLQDPVLTFSINCRMALVLGVALLMIAKPEMREAIGICLMSLVLGFASTILLWRGAPAAVGAPSGNNR